MGLIFLGKGSLLPKGMWYRVQTTHPTSGGAVTAVTNCCANCVDNSRPPAMGPNLPFFGQAGYADPLDHWRCSS